MYLRTYIHDFMYTRKIYISNVVRIYIYIYAGIYFMYCIIYVYKNDEVG